jgi:thiol-disulfide isomerase/thioredoxin
VSTARSFALLVLLCCGMTTAGATPAPEFTHRDPGDWLNSEPLTLGGLRGTPVLIEFWTYGCSNCLRTLPWIKSMHDRYAKQGLKVVSVHTPEFPHERDVERVRAAVRRHGIAYAVMIDNDFSYWRALGNRYWPAFYLLDAGGRIVARAAGELHAGEESGDDFERRIRQVLDDP